MGYQSFVAGSVLLTTPKESFINGFQSRLDEYFSIASDVFTIRQETFFSSGSFENIEVRITDAIDNLTGIKLGDDFKTLLFKTTDYSVPLGYKFYFNGNYWLTVNTDNIKSLAASCTVRRCNNVLKWMTESGSSLSEQCIIDYKIATPDNKNRTDPLIPDGTISVIAQLNDKTNLITENQRFLFGHSANNMQCFRVYGGGLSTFINNETTDRSTSQLIELAMGKNFINDDLDNLELGIADYYKYFTSSSAIVSNIQILPVSGSVLEDESQVFSVYLYSGGSQLLDTFTITVSGSSVVPTDNYSFSASANAFSITNNEKYLDDSLLIECLSGSSIRVFPVYLRGAW